MKKKIFWLINLIIFTVFTYSLADTCDEEHYLWGHSSVSFGNMRYDKDNLYSEYNSYWNYGKKQMR